MEPLPKFLINVLNELSENEGFSDYSYDITPGSKHGDGFIAMIVRISIKGIRNFKNDELKVICKYPPLNERRRETFGIMIAFEREVIAYKKVLPTFEKFQKEKGLNSKNEGWWTFPKCYYSEFNKETGETAIIMEDLCERGLIMAKNKKPSDYEQTKMYMTELGKFHAVSFALKNQKPEIYEEFKKLSDLQIKAMDNPMMQSLLAQNYEKCLSVLELPSENHLKEKLENFNKNLYKHFEECVSEKIAEPYAILIHSDCWINNVMFKYSKTNSIEEINIFDWQFLSYGSPALDIVSYIFCSTEKSLREKHFDELLKIYYGEFSKLLKILGNDSEKIFPYEELKNQLKKVGKYGLGMAFFAIPVLTSNDLPDLNVMAENLADTENQNLDLVNENSHEEFRERMRGIIYDTIELGYL